MAVSEHRAHGKKSCHCAVITVSDTRDEATDLSGRLIKELLGNAGHKVVVYRIVRDEADQIEAAVRAALANLEVEVLILNGGTGIAPRDGTYEVVERLLEKRLDGFGELFRFLSYGEIGSAAMMSRAVAGVAQRRVVASLPGSQAAVRLALEKLLVPELGHMVSQAQGK